MSISYLNDTAWEKWSREERFFSVSLYEYAKQDIKRFVEVVSEKSGLNLSSEENWDLGFEVCLYRDVLSGLGKKISMTRFSPKRTFDLCLFSESKVVIIETKVVSSFSATDLKSLSKDKQDIPTLLDLPELKRDSEKNPEVEVLAVALASSTYFEYQDKYGKKAALENFDGRITWNDIHDAYSKPLFERANSLYVPKEPRVAAD